MLIIGYLTEKEYYIYSTAKINRNRGSWHNEKNNLTT